MWKHGSVMGALALLLAATACQRPADTERPYDEPGIGEAEPWEEDQWMEQDEELAARIEEEVRGQLGEQALEDVDIEVEDGVVTLTGQVEDASMREQLRALIQDMEGVSYIDDRLEVGDRWGEEPMEPMDPMEPGPMEPDPDPEEPFPPTL